MKKSDRVMEFLRENCIVLYVIFSIVAVVFAIDYIVTNQPGIPTTEISDGYFSTGLIGVELSVKPRTITQIEEVYIYLPKDDPILDRDPYVNTPEYLDGLAEQICSEQYPDLDPSIVKSVIFYESNYNIKAENYDGSCVGLMQVSTYWNKQRAEDLGVNDFFDPVFNIRLGCDILNEFYQKTGSWELTLMLYNMNHSDAVRLYEQGIVSEYATKVLSRAETLREGDAQDAA